MYAEMKERGIAAGRVVKLVDGRIGIIDCVKPSPVIGEEQLDRAYVVGVEKEFADWVAFEQIATVYGVVEKPAYQPVLDALQQGQRIGFDWSLGEYFLTKSGRQVHESDITAMRRAGLIVPEGYGYRLATPVAASTAGAVPAA